MQLKSAICLSCQPAVIFINNSKNILWNSFCFQIRSCDFFGTREHWVNCNVLICQWMGLFKVKLVMNWYLLRPKQAQGTIYTPSSVLSAMMDGSERQRRSHRDELKLTTKQLQVDCFNQAAKEVAFCITYCGLILLLYTYIMDILYHTGLAENWNAVEKAERIQLPSGPQRKVI